MGDTPAQPPSKMACGCILNISGGGYLFTCGAHQDIPTFEELRSALHATPNEESLSVINRYNEKRATEIRSHPVLEITSWSELYEIGHLVLTTIGAKSGSPRSVPLGYVRDNDRLVLCAAVAGRPTNPAWYHNLVVNPSVTIETAGHTFSAQARVTEGQERERLWNLFASYRPIELELQAMTTRTIPVILLERA